MKSNQNLARLNLDNETFKRLLDHSSDEIFILDKNQKIVYVNKTCERHYGLKPAQVLGHQNAQLMAEGYWTPSAVDPVYENKKPVTMLQTTNLGQELLTTAIPVLNEQDEIEFVVSTARKFQRDEAFRVEKTEDTSVSMDDVQSHGIITDSDEMAKLFAQCKKAAKVDSTVLLTGESGTGKGMIAKYIHSLSPRSHEAMLTINCAAIPEDLLESELFGYVSGAFTGAKSKGKIGLIESADGGTVFLDEIAEMSLKTQAKLLQVIQNREFIPVGSSEVKSVDVRILAATNRDLNAMVENSEFREDLYYRLNVIEFYIPPLRERPEDIVPLIYHFLNQFNQKHQKTRLISRESIQLLAGYAWPGNVRQLQNVIERAVIMAESVIRVRDLPQDIASRSDAVYVPQAANTDSLDAALQRIERSMVLSAYAQHGSTRKVAQALHISQTRASRLLRKYQGDNE